MNINKNSVINKNDAIIDMINMCYPHVGITHRDVDLQYVKLWKDFRRNVLKLYNISFKEYATYNKRRDEFFAKLEARTCNHERSS